MNTKKHRITEKNRKKLYVFLSFLLLSTTYWSIIKLSATYSQIVNIETIYTNLTNDKVLYNKPIESIDVLFKTTGFNLLLQNFSKTKIGIDLNNLPKKGNIYYYATNANLTNLQTQFSLDKKILRVYPDTIFFDFGKLSTKIIKINPLVDINYKAGHSLIGEMEITPKKVTINGVKSQLDKIESINTMVLTKHDIKKDFTYEVLLDIPKEYHKIHFSTKNIIIKGIVEKYTEASLQVPFTLINLPNDITIKTLEESVKLTYIVSLDNYEKINVSDFKVVCDFNKISSNSSFLIPEIIKKSNLVSKVTCKPEKIEFLIKK